VRQRDTPIGSETETDGHGDRERQIHAERETDRQRHLNNNFSL